MGPGRGAGPAAGVGAPITSHGSRTRPWSPPVGPAPTRAAPATAWERASTVTRRERGNQRQAGQGCSVLNPWRALLKGEMFARYRGYGAGSYVGKGWSCPRLGNVVPAAQGHAAALRWQRGEPSPGLRRLKCHRVQGKGERKAKGEAAAEPRGASLSSLVSTQTFLQGARPRQGLCPPGCGAEPRCHGTADPEHGRQTRERSRCCGPASSGKAVSTGKRAELSPNKTSGLRTTPAGIRGGFVP